MDAVFTPEMLGDGQRSLSNRRWLMPLAFALAAVAMLPFDVSVVSVFEHKHLPGSIDRAIKEALEICEAFGHGFGASLIMIAIAVLDPPKRRYLPWVVAGSLGSGFVANIMKLFVHRIRPRDFDLLTGTVWNTFDRGFSGGAGMQSFPSAHTATAVGLALVLASLYPGGRLFFATMAFLVGMQRIASSSHFPSDVCAGATVGWIVGTVCVHSMTSSSRSTKS